MIKITVQRSLGSHIPDDVLRHNVRVGCSLPTTRRMRNCTRSSVYLDELIFVVPPRHPLAKARQVSIRQLGAETFVAHIVASPYRGKSDSSFQTPQDAAEHGHRAAHLQAIKRFVAMGNGVALLPEISVENELARGELVRIPVRELRLHRKLRLIYRKSASLSHAGRAFLKVAEAITAEQGGRYCFQRER